MCKGQSSSQETPKSHIVKLWRWSLHCTETPAYLRCHNHGHALKKALRIKLSWCKDGLYVCQVAECSGVPKSISSNMIIVWLYIDYILYDYMIMYYKCNPLAGLVATRFCFLSAGLWSWSDAIIARYVLFLQFGMGSLFWAIALKYNVNCIFYRSSQLRVCLNLR